MWCGYRVWATPWAVRKIEKSKGGFVGYTPGSAGPALYHGQRGKERKTASSFDPCGESKLHGRALTDRRLLGVGQRFESGGRCWLGPRHGPCLWRALFRVTPKGHQKVEPHNLKPRPIHPSALHLQRLIPQETATPAAQKRWFLVACLQYTPSLLDAHRPVVRKVLVPLDNVLLCNCVSDAVSQDLRSTPGWLRAEQPVARAVSG